MEYTSRTNKQQRELRELGKKIPISINDLKERYFNDDNLSLEELKALANYDQYRINYLNSSANDEQFKVRFLEMQAKANLTDYKDFVK